MILYAALFENVAKYKLNDETLKLYFDFASQKKLLKTFPGLAISAPRMG